MSDEYLAFCRGDPWTDCEGILSLSANTALLGDCLFPEDGIPQRNEDARLAHRLDLMLEAESTLRSFLGLLVGFGQRRKLTQFLLGFCDLLEITYDKSTGMMKECRFQIHFSDGVALRYSSRMCGCIIALNGKQDSFHRISPCAIDDLRRILAEIWEVIHGLPVWEVTAQNGSLVTVQHRLPMP